MGPLKKIQCDKNFEPPHSLLSPLSSNIITKESKPMETTFDLPIDLNGSSPTCEIHNYGMELELFYLLPICCPFCIYLQKKQKEKKSL
jgi:hypothetical protein